MLLTLALRPIYYFGQVLYYELNIDYIIETYCINKDKPTLQCNGKCHLAKQLEVVSQSDTNNETTFNIVVSFYPVFYNTYPNIIFKKALFIKQIKETFFYNRNYFFTFINRCYRPPSI